MGRNRKKENGNGIGFFGKLVGNGIVCFGFSRRVVNGVFFIITRMERDRCNGNANEAECKRGMQMQQKIAQNGLERMGMELTHKGRNRELASCRAEHK